MRPAQDYLTLLQLGVGINLVIGAYGSYRKGIESKIESELDVSREKIEEVLSTELPDNSPICQYLEKRNIKDLTNRELARYLGDTSIRFHKRSYKFDRVDHLIEPCLLPIGIMCLFLLFYASWWPKTKVSYSVAYPICLIVFLPAIWSYIRLTIDKREHEYHYRREASASYRQKSEKGHADRIRSSPIKGEITRVTNEVRKRYKTYIAKRSKAKL